MSSVAEIEAAVAALTAPQQEELLAKLARKLRKPRRVPARVKDPVEDIIGAFAGPREATGRRAEEILYGALE